MTTFLLSHRASLDHLTPPGHPERPDRIRAVEEPLGESRVHAPGREEATEGSLDLRRVCHNEHYINELQHLAPKAGKMTAPHHTAKRPGTWEAVMRGVG